MQLLLLKCMLNNTLFSFSLATHKKKKADILQKKKSDEFNLFEFNKLQIPYRKNATISDNSMRITSKEISDVVENHC